MLYVLYNPLANNSTGETSVRELEKKLSGRQYKKINALAIKNAKEFIDSLEEDDAMLLCGGDGTLNHMVNEVYELQPKQKILYYPAGSGNDFAHDCEEKPVKDGEFIHLNKYMESLPVVTVNGKKSYFINGIGFGLDGYCCEVGDRLRVESDEPVNYAGIAIKGLLGKFHPSNAKVTVDGKTKEYRRVWLAPTMIGKYYGGGMRIAPNQDRFDKEKVVSVVVWYKSGKLKTLMMFPKVFTGEHVKFTDYVEIRSGHEIKVEFDKPQALQIDGETVKNVTSYTVSYK